MNSDQQGQLQLVQLIFGLAVISGVVLNYYALYVLKSFSEEDYRLIGKNRSQQKTLHIIGIFALGIGAISGWYWFLKTKPLLEELHAQPQAPSTSKFDITQGRNQQNVVPKSNLQSDDRGSSVQRDSRHIHSSKYFVQIQEDQELALAQINEPEPLDTNVSTQPIINEPIGDSFANHAEFFSSLPKEISETEIDVIVSGNTRSYTPTQMIQTGLHLSDLIQKSLSSSTFNGSVFLETYLIGSQLSQKLLSQNPTSNKSIFDLDEDSRQLVLDAVHDDAEYFISMSQLDSYLTFQMLPIGIRYWFTSYSKVIMKDNFSTENHDALLRAFISGMLYVVFQARSSG